MSDTVFRIRAESNFERAHARTNLSRIRSVLMGTPDELLSLDEVTAVIKPNSESYRGIQTVPLSLVIGSEGRYRDFNRKFLPKKSHLFEKWTRIDLAHQKDINLPPVKLYELNGVYFVRDGNHRVSVAKSRGVEFIDAEVTSLDSEIRIDPSMSQRDLRRQVIEYEKKIFWGSMNLKIKRPGIDISFTSPGRFEHLLKQVRCYQKHLSEEKGNPVPFEDVLMQWYDQIYLPIVSIIREGNFVSYFQGRTETDLYVWIFHHWEELRKKYGKNYPLIKAAQDFKRRTENNWLLKIVKRLFHFYG